MDLMDFFGGRTATAEPLAPNPSDDYWYNMAPGAKTAAGISVNESRALTYSACWAATMLLSSSEGMLPLKLFKKRSGGGSDVMAEHPVHKLISSRPNPEMTSMMFRSSRTIQQVNRGNCYAEIERNEGGIPVNLWPIHASRIPPETNIMRENGSIVYFVNNNDGTKTKIKQENMLHVPSPISEDGVIGLGVVTQARLSIALGLATETQGASYFGSGALPKIVIEGITKFKNKEEREEFRRQWNELHGGPENANKPAILHEGMKITPLNFSAEDSQFLETRQFSIEEVARWYGVPPHLIGHLLRATYSNIEHLSLEFVKYSLMRWLVLWEQEINRKLLTPNEQKTMYCRHIVDALERGDLASRTAAFKEEVFNGKKTINEWRAMDEENPIGPAGDIHWVQQPMIPVEIAAKGPQPAEPPKPPEPQQEQNQMAAAIALAMAPVVTSLSEVATGLKQLTQTTDANHAATLARLASAENEQRLLAGVFSQASTDLENLAAVVGGVSKGCESVQESVALLSEQAAASVAFQQQLAGALLRDVLCRLMSVEVHNVKQVAQSASRFDARLLAFYDEKHRRTMELAIISPLGAVLLANGKQGDPVMAARTYIDGHVAESMQQLLAVCDCQADELAARVDACVAKWHEERTTYSIGD